MVRCTILAAIPSLLFKICIVLANKDECANVSRVILDVSQASQQKWNDTIFNSSSAKQAIQMYLRKNCTPTLYMYFETGNF